jgi:glycosyltransferase involved in cell wall biosynthesis
VPLVVTEVGGVPDVVTPAEALRVPPGRPEALAEALQQLRRDPAGAAARARAAVARLASAYAIEPWLDRHEAVYRSLPGITPERAAAR